MGNGNVGKATVRRTLVGRKVPECLTTLDTVCSAGAACQAVQASPVAKTALDVLTTSVTTAHASLTVKLTLTQSLLAAIETLDLDFAAVRLAIRSYEAAVGAMASGDASLINKAGLLARDLKISPLALGPVPLVRSRKGKHPGEAILSWPRGPGATGYAIEVNFTPGNPAGPWVALMAGSGRRRVVKGPTPGAELLARVASVGSDGTLSAWSDSVLATTL